MNEKVFIGGLIAIVVAAAFISAFALKHEEYASFRSFDLKLDGVNDSHVTVDFIFNIASKSFDGNLSMKVYDAKTNLLLAERKFKLPENPKRYEVKLSFEKDRDYLVTARLAKGWRTYDVERFSISNLNSLKPAKKDVRAFLKDADFLILGKDDDSVKVKSRFYIESLKNYSVTFHVKVVQYESGVLASESWIRDNITKGKTNLVESEFEVPERYNYLVKLELWRDGALLKSWSRALKLDPSKRVPEGEKEEKMNFEVEKFVKPVYEEGDYSHPKGVPGFEILIAVAGMLAALRIRRL